VELSASSLTTTCRSYLSEVNTHLPRLVLALSLVYAAVKAVLIPFPYSHTEALVQIRADFGRGGNSRQDWVTT